LNPKFFRNGIVMLVLVVGTAALLFTWIQSNGTNTNSRTYSEFLTDVTQNKIDKVSQQGETLTVTAKGSPTSTYTVTVPAPIVTKVYDDMALAAKAGNLATVPQYGALPAPDTSWLGLLLTGLLPLLVITNHQCGDRAGAEGNGRYSNARFSERAVFHTTAARTAIQPAVAHTSSTIGVFSTRYCGRPAGSINRAVETSMPRL